MKKLKGRRKSREVDPDNLDPMSTPITNYKNRRKLMQENKIKAHKKQENGGDEENESVHGSQATNSGSFIGSVTSSFNKSKKSTNTKSDFLEDTSSGFLNSLGFSKNDQKDLEQSEKLIYEYFRKRITRWSYYILFIASYCLLNTCIGFSSAPFYETTISCYIFDPTDECEILMSKVNRLYSLELLVGLMIVFQGMIGLIFVDRDNIKKMNIAKMIKRSCKAALIVYIIMFGIRGILFWDVRIQLNNINPKRFDKGFGSFYGEYVKDSVWSVVTTSIVMFLSLLFYLSNFYIIRLMSKMIDFVNSQMDEYIISQSILVNPNDIYMTQYNFDVKQGLTTGKHSASEDQDDNNKNQYSLNRMDQKQDKKGIKSKDVAYATAEAGTGMAENLLSTNTSTL